MNPSPLNNLSLLIFILILHPNLCFSQADKTLLENVKRINDGLYSGKNQVIRIDCTSKIRYKSIPSIHKTLIYFGDPDNGYQDLSYFDSISHLLFKADKNYYYYKHPDSATFKKIAFEKPFDLNFGSIPNRLYFLNYLPIDGNSFLKDKSFSTFKIEYQYQNKDTIVIVQWKKKSQIVRKLTLDSNWHIYRVEFEDSNIESVVEKWGCNFKVYPEATLDQIADSLDFGPFNHIDNLKRIASFTRRNDSLKFTNSKIILPLIGGKTLEIDTSKIKYYLVDLWYLGCGPCHQIRPELEKINLKLDSTKVLFFGYNEYDLNDDVLRFVNRKSYKIRELDHTIFSPQQFHTNTHPTILVLDNKLRIVERYVGFTFSNQLALTLFLKRKKLFLP